MMIKTLALLSLVTSTLLSTGCGQSIVTAVGVSSAVVSGDQYADVFADFNTSGMTLPSVTLPIANPLDPNPIYGQLSLTSSSSTSAQVSIDLDLTVLAKLPASNSTLPNGTSVPVSGTDATHLLSIPVPNSKFVVYAALNINALQPGQNPVAMIGIALPFTQFDSIGSAVGNEDLFIPFSVSGISGSAGMFTGKTSGTSGIAIFIDANGLIATVGSSPTTGSLAELFALPSSREEAQRYAPARPARLGYPSISPGMAKESEITRHLSTMGAEHTRLTVD